MNGGLGGKARGWRSERGAEQVFMTPGFDRTPRIELQMRFSLYISVHGNAPCRLYCTEVASLGLDAALGTLCQEQGGAIHLVVASGTNQAIVQEHHYNKRLCWAHTMDPNTKNTNEL